ncbi:MAG TPA: hypothetical protein VNG90_04985 [Candidatus Acidoferrum sp.]|nr:hypothetical protein [Candidatus Acidoferrum sp.]
MAITDPVTMLWGGVAVLGGLCLFFVFLWLRLRAKTKRNLKEIQRLMEVSDAYNKVADELLQAMANWYDQLVQNTISAPMRADHAKAELRCCLIFMANVQQVLGSQRTAVIETVKDAPHRNLELQHEIKKLLNIALNPLARSAALLSQRETNRRNLVNDGYTGQVKAIEKNFHIKTGALSNPGTTRQLDNPGA